MATTPKQTRTVINSLQAAITSAQEELKNYPPEKPVLTPPDNFRGKVWFFLDQAIQEGTEKAKKSKLIDPSTHTYIHCTPFPEELYNCLEKNYTGFMESLQNLGFDFYMTHNGEPHPMVKFTFHF